MKIDFEPIASILDAEEVLAIVEIRSLFYNITHAADLEWDEDTLLESFIDQLDDRSAREDYRAEPTAGVDEAKSRLLDELYALIESRHGRLGAHSPFTWDFANGILLERRAFNELTAVGVGYLWMSFFWLMHSDKHYMVLTKEDRLAFTREFARVFEHVCCYLISGRAPKAIWYFGNIRSADDLLAQMNNLVSACGNGQVKTRDELEPHQKTANDAGIDVIAVELRDGTIPRNAQAYLLGATIQQSDRRGKIMGGPEIDRFASFFAKKPLLAYMGVLAVPFERSEFDELQCRDQNSIYVGREDFLRELGGLPAVDNRSDLALPRQMLWGATRAIAQRMVIADNDDGQRLDSTACKLGV